MRSSLAILSALVLLGWGSLALAQDAGVPQAPPTPDGGTDGGTDGGDWAEGEDDEDGWGDDEDEDGSGHEVEAEGEDEDESADGEDEPVEDTAVGADDESVEGQEGSLLPARPAVRYRPALPEPGDDDFTLVIPPILYERQGGVQTIAAFPLFYLRESGPTTELSIPPYYAMRGPQNWDVLFPLFWWYRGEGHHTWAVPPLWHHEAPDGFDFGFAPFVMNGRHDTHHYTLIPPLLTVDWGIDAVERYTLSTLFWRVWEGDIEHWGVFPFLWVENGERTSYTIAPPLFFRFEDRNEGTALTIVPPFYHRDEPNGSYWGIPPLFHHNSGPDHTSTTIFPLLSHYSAEPDVFRLTLGGVFWYWRDHGDETIVTPLYQRFRGATEMDAVAPFFFYVRDPRTDAVTLAIPPLIWHLEDPSSSATVVLPFFARFEERGRSTTWITPLVGNHQDHEHHDETTWVFPTIQVSNWHDGDAVNIHPLFYFESVPSHHHSVLAPLWWDFESFEGDRNRYTVVFPFFWRFREGNTTSTLVLNMYHRERVRSESSEWEFHFFPFFSYGESSQGGHWWKIFHGLAGYERRGPYGVTTLFYVPFQTDGPPLPSND